MAQLAKLGPAAGPCYAPPRMHSRGHANWTSQLSLGPGHRPLVQVNVPRSLKEAWEGNLEPVPWGLCPLLWLTWKRWGTQASGPHRQRPEQPIFYSPMQIYRKKFEPCPTRSQLNSRRKTAANVYREVLWATPCSKSITQYILTTAS